MLRRDQNKYVVCSNPILKKKWFTSAIVLYLSSEIQFSKFICIIFKKTKQIKTKHVLRSRPAEYLDAWQGCDRPLTFAVVWHLICRLQCRQKPTRHRLECQVKILTVVGCQNILLLRHCRCLCVIYTRVVAVHAIISQTSKKNFFLIKETLDNISNTFV